MADNVSVGGVSLDLGFNTNGLENSLTKAVAPIKTLIKNAVNGIKASIDIAAASVSRLTAECSRLMKTYQTQIEAEARLAATMRNTTSASDAQIQSVKDLASELQTLGVVGDEVQLAGAQELATYIGNVESLKKILPVLDDMIAQQYGFSASTDSAVTIATMLGKVLQGQTSALSRYGYYFDEAQEKLLKYGTEEQRVATLAAVVEESVGGVNAALASTPTGKVKQLSNDFGDLKETLGKLVTDVLSPIVAQLDIIVKKLNEVFTLAGKGVNELLGIDTNADFGSGIVGSAGDIAESIGSIADDTQEDIKDKIKETEELFKKSGAGLAGFDKLNVLSQPSSDDDSEDSNTDKTAESAEKAQDAVEKLDNAIKNINLDGVKKQLQKTAEFFKPLVDGTRKNVSASVENAKNGVSGFLESYGDEVQEYSGSISGHLKNTAVQTRNGLAGILEEAALSQERTGKQLSQGYTDFLGGAAVFTLSFANVFADMFDIISGNFEEWVNDNRTLIGEFFDGINLNFANFLSTIGHIFEDIGHILTDWWEESGAPAFDKLSAAFFDVISVLLDFWNSYITPFIDYIIDSVGDLWDNHLSALWSGVLDLISSLMEAIAAIWNGFLRPLYDTFIKRIMVGVMGALKSLWDIIYGLFGAVIDIVRGVVRVAKGLLDFITGIFTGSMDKAMDGVEEIFNGTVIAIWGLIKGVINTIIGALNTVWSALYGVLKSIVDGVGDFVGMIGDLFGQEWSFSMPDEVPRMPRLAHGGLVRAPTIAVVGDNPNAGSDPEVVSPLSKLDTIMGRKDDEALAQILMYLKMLYEVCKEERPIELNAEVDEVQLFRNIVRQNNSYKRTHGGRSAFA